MHVEPKKFVTAKRVIDRAVKEIQKRGWAKHTFRLSETPALLGKKRDHNMKKGAVCMLGALYYAMGGTEKYIDNSAVLRLLEQKRHTVLCDALAEAFGAEDDDVINTIPRYNDALRTRRKDAIAKLKKAASKPVLTKVCKRLAKRREKVIVQVDDVYYKISRGDLDDFIDNWVLNNMVTAHALANFFPGTLLTRPPKGKKPVTKLRRFQ